MIAPSSIRVSFAGSLGDWPCLADRITTVLFGSACIISPTFPLT